MLSVLDVQVFQLVSVILIGPQEHLLDLGHDVALPFLVLAEVHDGLLDVVFFYSALVQVVHSHCLHGRVVAAQEMRLVLLVSLFLFMLACWHCNGNLPCLGLVLEPPGQIVNVFSKLFTFLFWDFDVELPVPKLKDKLNLFFRLYLSHVVAQP